MKFLKAIVVQDTVRTLLIHRNVVSIIFVIILLWIDAGGGYNQGYYNQGII